MIIPNFYQKTLFFSMEMRNFARQIRNRHEENYYNNLPYGFTLYRMRQ